MGRVEGAIVGETRPTPTKPRSAVAGVIAQVVDGTVNEPVSSTRQTPATPSNVVLSNAATQKQWEAYGPEGQARVLASIALRRLGEPQDIANAVLFLASPMANYVNGQVLSVDGGK